MNIAKIKGLPRLHLMTLALRCAGSIASKPIHGGIFNGRYLLVRGKPSGSGFVPSMVYVVDSVTDLAVGMGARDDEALADARNTLATYTPEAIAEFMRAKEAEWEARKAKPKLPSIAKRRRAIFDAANGACHYCGTVLTFDGAWHVEHRQPKSRGGSDESENLTAACGLCNLRKKDMTEAEFRAAFGLPEAA